MRNHKRIFFIILALFLALPVLAQQAKTAAALWRDRGDVAALDLLNGPGGKEHQPGTHFKFIEESKGGTAPKFEVEDENGAKWKVKLGPEVKSETAATRLLWAAGYFADEDYYRPQIRVQGKGSHAARSTSQMVASSMRCVWSAKTPGRNRKTGAGTKTPLLAHASSTAFE
jgi:hypothetical protein